MKIFTLKEIPVTGLTLYLNAKETWLVEILTLTLKPYSVLLNSILGQIDLKKTNDIVDLHGQLNFDYHPQCAHCGRELDIHEAIKLRATLAPLPPDFLKEIKEDQGDTEIAIDDTDFCFYENDQIRIDTIVNDEIALALPYNYYCKDKITCKIARPIDSHITINEASSVRWNQLKDLKINKN